MEEAENSEAEARAANPAADPAAIALSLHGASREKANQFLDGQIVLTRLQARELDHELGLRHWSLWVRHISGVLKLAFEFSIALVLLGLVALLANDVWAAAHDNGLVIEPFSVPPDLAARGLTGQVVATQMLDNLSALQALNNSVRAPNSYANNWGDDIKVEIPETGISIGQLNTYLHKLLGHQTHITGEVVRNAAGIAVTARVGAEAGKRFIGPDGDFDALLQQATGAVYASTQPYRYAINLADAGKIAEAEAFLSNAARSLPPAERAWAYAGLFNMLGAQHRAAEVAEAARASVAVRPDFAWGWGKMTGAASTLEQVEAALAADRKAMQLLDGPSARDLRAEAVPSQRQAGLQTQDELLGDYADLITQARLRYPTLANASKPAQQVAEILAVPGANISNTIVTPFQYARSLTVDHDIAGARRMVAEAPGFLAALKTVSDNRHDIRGQVNIDAGAHHFRGAEMYLATETQDWPLVVRDAALLDAEELKLNAAYASGALYPPTSIWPHSAYAQARLGDFAAAHAQIDKTPDDCDLCLRMRGKIDAAQKNYGGADFWFARAVAIAPSIPFADADWGQSLLERGKPEEAIAKFKLANQKGPHFADPLEGWGEALMAQNRSDLAVAKFSEANKYATNWGRLHLKWGEALAYAGKKDEAQKQFAIAAPLDLSVTDKAELARVSHG